MGRVDIRSWHSMLQCERDAELCGGIRFMEISSREMFPFHLSPSEPLRPGAVWGLWCSLMELIRLWLLYLSYLS